VPVVEEQPVVEAIQAKESSHIPVEVPWREVGLLISVVGLGWYGYRFVRKVKKRVVFALPKELQCEA
jgi:hypothetical protein